MPETKNPVFIEYRNIFSVTPRAGFLLRLPTSFSKGNKFNLAIAAKADLWRSGQKV
jgi:hypothetical protein